MICLCAYVSFDILAWSLRTGSKANLLNNLTTARVQTGPKPQTCSRQNDKQPFILVITLIYCSIGDAHRVMEDCVAGSALTSTLDPQCSSNVTWYILIQTVLSQWCPWVMIFSGTTPRLEPCRHLVGKLSEDPKDTKWKKNRDQQGKQSDGHNLWPVKELAAMWSMVMLVQWRRTLGPRRSVTWLSRCRSKFYLISLIQVCRWHVRETQNISAGRTQQPCILVITLICCSIGIGDAVGAMENRQVACHLRAHLMANL